MWTEAAKWLAKFDDAVLTLADVDGYPVSVRVTTAGYDATTGELATALPESLRAAGGPADLLCHRHNEKLWGLRMIHISGRLERRDNQWVFISTAFTPPPKGGLVSFIRSLSGSAQTYLDRRGLPRPEINWAAIKAIQRRARDSQRS